MPGAGCGGYTVAMACVAGLVSSGASAAEWSFVPSARVSASYTQNPRLAGQDGTASAGVISELASSLSYRTERLDVELAPLFRFARYASDSSLDSDTQSLDLHVDRGAERMTWLWGANLSRDTTLTSELGTTGLTQVDGRRQNLLLSAAPSFQLTERVSVGGQASWTDTRYMNVVTPELSDYRQSNASVFASYGLTERTQMSLSAGAGLFQPQVRGSTRDTSVSVQLKHELGLQWSLGLSAGPSWIESDFGSNRGTLYNVQMARRGERLQLSATLGRSLVPTGRGVQTRRDALTFAAARSLTDRISAGISLTASRNLDVLPVPGFKPAQIRYASIDGRLSWQLTPQLSASMAVGGTDQRSPFARGGARGYQGFVTFAWSGQPWSVSR